MDDFKRTQYVSRSGCAFMGPGGYNCRCCGPKLPRKLWRRYTRRRLKQADLRTAED